MEMLSAIEPKVVLLVLLNILLWAGIGFLFYKLVRWKKKQSNDSPELELDERV